MMFTEGDLVLKAKQGHKDAYQELVQTYQSKLFALAYGIVRNREDSKDIVQESFVKAYFALHTFQGKSSFYTWIYRIVYNMSIDFKRRHKEILTEDSVLATKEDEVGLVPEQAASNRETAHLLNVAYGQLSSEHKAVLYLREMEGLSYEEISSVVGASMGTVMSRLHYARKKMQEFLTPILGEKYVVQKEI